MAYLPLPGPVPDPDDAPFWEYCRQHELRFQRCTVCGRFRHPPAPCCPHCRSFESEWVRAPEVGELFSYTVVHHPVSEAIRPHLPYNIAIVAFPECGGVRLISNVVDAAPDELRIGMKLQLIWEAAPDGQPLPRFKTVRSER